MGWIVFSILLVLAVVFRWVDHGWEEIINSDGRGYYAYLPASIIFHDFKFNYFFDGSLNLPKDYTSNFLFYIDGNYVIKYPVGVAIMLIPFFIVAIIFSFIFQFPIDGYSFFFQIFESLAAITYVTLAIILLYRLLRKYDIQQNIAAIIVIGIVFATNLTHYTVLEPSLSHAFSFVCVVAFLWCLNLFSTSTSYSYWYFACCLLGLIILIRPVNGVIVLFAPFLFNTVKRFVEFLGHVFKNKINAIFGIVLASLVIFLQPLVWYLQTGHFYVWTYVREGFNWDNPQFFNLLFSYRKGWFVYTPFMFLIIPGLIAMLFHKQWFKAFISILFWSGALYIISSWGCWYYGGSFGQRPLIDFYGPAALTIAAFFTSIKPTPWKVLLVTVAILIPLNLIQSYQVYSNILHYDSMNKEKYWKVFLKTSNKYRWILFNNPHNNPPLDIKNKIKQAFFNDFEGCPSDWQNCRFDDVSVLALSGNHVIKLDSEHGFSPKLNWHFNSSKDSINQITILGWYPTNQRNIDQSSLVISIDENGQTSFKKEMQINKLKSINSENEWTEFRIDLPFDNKELKPADLTLYFYNNSNLEFWIDDIGVYALRN